MEPTMPRKTLVWFLIASGFSCFIIHVNGLESSPEAVVNDPTSPRVIPMTLFGADPTGKNDSTSAFLRVIESLGSRKGLLMDGITNLGGAHINLDGGTYLISRPLRMPVIGAGNLMISGGTLQASNKFPREGYLIDLSGSSTSHKSEYITLKDLMLDCNFRGGGITVVNSHRTSIDNCYIAHFRSNGILVKQGHETYIRNSFIGQHITTKGVSRENNFSGTGGVNQMGNDTDNPQGHKA